jgi:hypothetical protein
VTDSGHTTRSATVNTLTAEVRTLVVGARQVTLSVFNQLDVVHPLWVEPMGRVRPRENGYRLSQIHVVGRAVDDGALVRSRLETRDSFEAGGGYLRGQQGKLYEPTGADPNCPACEGTGSALPNRQLNELGQVSLCPSCNPRRPVVDQWMDLPLIVLAGLR